MLNKIRYTQEEGRILPDVKVDYDNVNVHNPFVIISNLYKWTYHFGNKNKISYIQDFDEHKRKISIIYLKDFEPDYFRVETSKHDGTLIFTKELFIKLLNPIIFGESYYTENLPDDFKDNPLFYNLEYIVGDIYYFKDFGIKNINNNNWHGLEEVLVMPVKINYIKSGNV
jgi:hypothetical protein